MKVGDIVRAITGHRHHCKIGIITHIIEPYDHNLRESDRLVEVMYDHDEILSWSDKTLEVVNKLI